MIFLVSGALLFPAMIHAKLKFTQTSVLVKATNEDKTLHSKFDFINAGDEPVYVLSVASSCECTVPTLDKREYAPGESGEILVNYNIGINEGNQSQTITVITSETTENSYMLTFNAELPRGLRGAIPSVEPVAPRQLFWSQKPYETKTVTVDLKTTQGSRFKVACDAGATFQIETETSAEKKEARIKITPVSTGGEMRGELTVSLETENGSNSNYKVSLRILPEKAARKL